jgi:hypothetical protein
MNQKQQLLHLAFQKSEKESPVLFFDLDDGTLDD